jgi:hypothetical protein
MNVHTLSKKQNKTKRAKEMLTEWLVGQAGQSLLALKQAKDISDKEWQHTPKPNNVP